MRGPFAQSFWTRALLAGAAVLAPLTIAGCSHPAYYAPPPPSPSAFAAAEQQGFADGAAAARHDIRTGRPPALDDHGRFRRPPVAPPFIEAYRRGFRQGYSATMHIPPPGPGM